MEPVPLLEPRREARGDVNSASARETLVDMQHMETIDGITYRPVRPDETLSAAVVESRGFGGVYEIRQGRLENDKQYRGIARSNCAHDGEDIVGTCSGVDMTVGVPGGVAAMSGITDVAVSPTHRRRGILTNMMRRQLQQERDQGFAMAGLWSSEAPIYGRFGYGMAVEQQEVAIQCDRSAFRRGNPVEAADGKMRFAAAEEIRRVGPDIWRRKIADTPGMASRVAPQWNRTFSDNLADDHSGHLFNVTYSEDSECLGYVSYRVSNSKDPDGLDYKTLKVRELIALNPRAEAAIWRFLLDIDLVHLVQHDAHPVRSLLWRLLDDPRCMSQKPYDALWLRILDVPKALSARTYSVPGEVTLEVVDEFGGWTSGTFALTVQSDGSAECNTTDADADIKMPIATLGAIYMGDHDLASLHAANRCTELTAGSVELAAAMFADPRVHHVVAEF